MERLYKLVEAYTKGYQDETAAKLFSRRQDPWFQWLLYITVSLNGLITHPYSSDLTVCSPT